MKKNPEVKIVKVNYPYGDAKFFIEKKKQFLFFETWHREKEIIGGLGGTFESDKDFPDFISACDHVRNKMNAEVFTYEEETLTINDLVW